MSNENIVKIIRDASVDAQSLSEFMYKPADFMVERRLAPPIHSLQYYLDYLNTIPSIVSNAIDSTAIEGGVVADTFVTKTANGVGQVARTLRDKNSDTLDVRDFGAVGDGVTDDTLAIQAAIDVARDSNKVVYANGIFKISDTVFVCANVDFRGSVFESYVQNKVSIAVANHDNSYLQYKTVYMPDRLLNRGDWSWSEEDQTGVSCINNISCKVFLGGIRNFTTNLRVTSINTGRAGRSTAYNEYFIGHLDNGKINLLLDSHEDGSWTNENNFYGGRFSQDSSRGVNVLGCRHIAIISGDSPNTLNNNVFYKPSIEGNVPEYHVEIQGSFNCLRNARWEANPPKLLYKKKTESPNAPNQASKNLIDGGYNSSRIVTTNEGEGGAFNNELRGEAFSYKKMSSTEGGNRFSNSYSVTAPVFSVFSKGVEQADFNKYNVAISARSVSVKQTDKPFPQVSMDNTYGRLKLGTGDTEPSTELSANDSLGLRVHSNGLWNASSASIGNKGFPWKSLYLSESVGFWGVEPLSEKPTVTGSLSDGTALKSLLTALSSYGLITDDTTE